MKPFLFAKQAEARASPAGLGGLRRMRTYFCANPKRKLSAGITCGLWYGLKGQPARVPVPSETFLWIHTLYPS